MSATDYCPFAETYLEARTRFRRVAAERKAQVTTFRNACGPGPQGEELCTDVARLGPDAPRRLLFCVSGTHGIEGYCGSAIQTGLLRDRLDEAMPDDTAVLFVHALNPHGFAFQRRVNEDNIDLNRNFVDHDLPPCNSGYAELHDALAPPDWDGPGRKAADAFLREWGEQRGFRALQAVVTMGQWTHADGLFYGGTAPTWSHRTLRAIAEQFLPGVERIGYIDLHTGLGARGYGEPIFRGGLDPGARERARRWYGDRLSSSEHGTSSSTQIVGNTATLIAGLLADDQMLTAITLEFGTLPGGEVLTALRADNWLYLCQAQADGMRAQIKDQIRAAFYPGDTGWRASVWARAVEVFGQARKGLAGDD